MDRLTLDTSPTPYSSNRPSAIPASFRLRIDGPGDGAWNMAVDEALMAFARSGEATLRFYTWEPGCLSLGRNQSTTPHVQGRSREELNVGEAVVRRPTGGRSVYHHRELTYSLTVPDRAWGGPRRLYRRVNRALRLGLASLGASVDTPPAPEAEPDTPQELEGDPGPDSGDGERDSSGLVPSRAGMARGALGSLPCFHAPAAGEVTAGGRKLVGSAQWRHRGVLLQHGSVLLLNEQGRGNLCGADDAPAESAAIGLSELVPALPESADLIRALTVAFCEEFECRPARTAPDRRLERALEIDARELVVEKYRTPEWTWRR